MIKKVLITGATGLVGKALTIALIKKGYQVNCLVRKKTNQKNQYLWDLHTNKIDTQCFDEVDAIIHLAGEAVATKKWTNKRKKIIIDSRVKSTELLYKSIGELKNHQIKSFISASAVGFYGDCGDEILTEESSNGYGFLAHCCKLWENAVDEGKKLSLRIVKLRTGIVLSRKGGALPELAKPIKLFAGCALGTGTQWASWLHIHDMVNLYIYAIENPLLSGAYNACAPNPITNTNLTKAIAKQINRPFWPIKISETALKLILGERTEAILMSSNTSAQKILNTGFKFEFTQLNEALKNLYQRK